MSGWTPGSAVIERLIQERRLESVKGAHADGSPWLERARQTLAAARAIEQASPDSAFVLAYDAARQACTALLAQQGLRPTTSGGRPAGLITSGRPPGPAVAWLEKGPTA